MAKTDGVESTLMAGGGMTLASSSDHLGSMDTVAPPAARGADFDALRPIDPENYVIGRELARGGMGRILAARDRRLGRPVAIKELLSRTDEFRVRFEREARITAKLQHPAIVSLLEAGAWPSGEPFYVMKLVAGESFDKVIARQTTIAGRLSLLPHVIAAVDALAYAHDQQVIHRDLKPANILIGEFGETVVIDWGLAKDLSAHDAELEVGPYRARAPLEGETVVGSVMGTPAYMPIEQAKGEVVDERADVYALGALLYHLLVGEPPFTGPTAQAILDEVVRGQPVAIATRAPAMPPDLIAIVDKAMARDAADRYPTAKQLADDLKRFQTGQLVGAHRYSRWQLVRRWARRYRAVLAAVAVAATVLAVLAIASVTSIVREQQRTEEQRTAADKSRGQAEELMDFMLVDLRDKLRTLGRLDLLDDVSKKALAYYRDTDVEISDADLARRATAQASLGDVLADRGRISEALPLYRAALHSGEALVARNPADRDARRRVVTAHGNLGAMLSTRSYTAAALVEYRAMLAEAGNLGGDDADRRLRALAHHKLGLGLYAQGDGRAALTELAQAHALEEARLAEDPESVDKRYAMADLERDTGEVLRARGDHLGALTRELASQQLLAALVHARPGDARFAIALARIGQAIGETQVALGRLTDAESSYAAARSQLEALVARDPSNGPWSSSLRELRSKIGQMWLVGLQPDRAILEFRAALAIADELARRDPTWTNALLGVGKAHEHLGRALEAKAERAAALAEYRLYLEVAERLVAADPDDLGSREQAANAHNLVAQVTPDPTVALRHNREAVALLEVVVARDPSAVRQRNLALFHRSVGVSLMATGDSTGALAAYRQALGIIQQLVATEPSYDNLYAAQETYVGLGDILQQRGEGQPALAMYRAGVELLERAGKVEIPAADAAFVARIQAQRTNLVLVGQTRVGEAYLKLGQLPEALAQFQRCQRLSESFAAANPEDFEGQVGLGDAEQRVADVLLAQGKPAEALVGFQRSVVQMERVTAAFPKRAPPLFLALARGRVCDALLAVGKADAAIAECRRALRLFEADAALAPNDTSKLNDVAVFHSKLGDTLLARGRAREALVEQQASRAMLDKLAATDPSNAMWAYNSADARRAIGDAYVGLHSTSLAISEYRLALARFVVLAKQSPGDADLASSIASVKAKLAALGAE